jgi:glycosyltransferase involved in cell wall biosynthesis
MKLLIFTQKVDKNDSNLGFFHAWIIEFAKKCESVKVICLYKGEYDLPQNVEVFSLGKELGLGQFNEIQNVFKYVFKLRGSYDRVFVHMNPIYLVLCGWYFKVKNIPVFMWYVHKSVDAKLQFATFFVKNIFTSAKESFQLKTNKVVYLGHGIEVNILPFTSHIQTTNELEMVHVGRITQIKHLEVAIDVLSQLVEKGVDAHLVLLGECETEVDKIYREKLLTQIESNDLKNRVIFGGGVLHMELAERLKKAHIALNMTPSGGMDKAVLEALALGIPAFTANTAFTPVFKEYKDYFMYHYKDANELTNKIYAFMQMKDKEQIIEKLSNRVREEYSLSKLVETVTNIMNQ